MNNKQLKAYISDKFGLKVKSIGLFGMYGYCLLERVSLDTLNDGWELYNKKIYSSLSEIIDDLSENGDKDGK